LVPAADLERLDVGRDEHHVECCTGLAVVIADEEPPDVLIEVHQ
jgi:hypothetical protein